MSHCLNGAKYNYLATDREFEAKVMTLKFKETTCLVNHLSVEFITLV